MKKHVHRCQSYFLSTCFHYCVRSRNNIYFRPASIPSGKKGEIIGLRRRWRDIDGNRKRGSWGYMRVVAGSAGMAVLVVTGIGNKDTARAEGHFVARFTVPYEGSTRWQDKEGGRLESTRIAKRSSSLARRPARRERCAEIVISMIIRYLGYLRRSRAKGNGRENFRNYGAKENAFFRGGETREERSTLRHSTRVMHRFRKNTFPSGHPRLFPFPP